MYHPPPPAPGGGGPRHALLYHSSLGPPTNQGTLGGAPAPGTRVGPPSHQGSLGAAPSQSTRGAPSSLQGTLGAPPSQQGTLGGPPPSHQAPLVAPPSHQGSFGVLSSNHNGSLGTLEAATSHQGSLSTPSLHHTGALGAAPHQGTLGATSSHHNSLLGLPPSHHIGSLGPPPTHHIGSLGPPPSHHGGGSLGAPPSHLSGSLGIPPPHHGGSLGVPSSHLAGSLGAPPYHSGSLGSMPSQVSFGPPPSHHSGSLGLVSQGSQGNSASYQGSHGAPPPSHLGSSHPSSLPTPTSLVAPSSQNSSVSTASSHQGASTVAPPSHQNTLGAPPSHHGSLGAPLLGSLGAPPPVMGSSHSRAAAPLIYHSQPSIFSHATAMAASKQTVPSPLFPPPPAGGQQPWAPPPSTISFSVPPPGHVTTPMYVHPYSHPLVSATYPGYPPNQYLGYPPQPHYPPTFTPSPIGATYSLPPPPVHHGQTRDRSPVRGDTDRADRNRDRDRERSRHREDTERGRDRDRRMGRHREDKRGDRRKEEDWRDREHKDRERERIKRDKERRENIPSAYRKEGARSVSRKPSLLPHPGTLTGSSSLVPYEDDSETEEGGGGEEGRGRSREDKKRESRDGRDGRDNRDNRDSRENSSRRERSRDPSSASELKIKQEQVDYTKLTPEQVIEMERKVWIRSAPADLYYTRDSSNPGIMRATERSIQQQKKFETLLIEKSKAARAMFPVEEPPRFRFLNHHGHSHEGDEDDCSSSDDDEENPHNHRVESLDWLEFRSKAVNRAHPEVWQNMEGELNDGPACRCSKKARESGIRHGIYVGETPLPELDMQTNNWSKLHHYRVTISPPTNFLIKHPTIIHHDEHEFIFEGFSMFTVDEIPDLPVCKVVRFNIEYNILYFEEKMPENFTLGELDLFHKYFFYELLELWDWSVDGRFYFMPRFVRDLSENGKEILSMNEVLAYMLQSYTPLTDEMDLVAMTQMSQSDWQRIADRSKGMLVTYPGNKPSTLRVDQLDREQDSVGVLKYPDIVHFGIRPPQLSYAGSQEYQKAWREFVKFRHLLANMAKPTFKDRRELEAKEHALQEMRSNSKLKRDCTAVVSSQGYIKTGLMTDIVQHAMLLPVLVNHLRLNNSLDHLEKRINYKFKNRYLLQQAVTHPSYKENFGTNPDHIRNTLSNCGIRQPTYGDKKIHYQNTRKRGINMLINIMSRFGKKIETESKVQHNERLEFLGDAVVEFITSVHLFYMFPDLEEGGLATYRAAIVQNQHLAVLAGGLGLERYMLYAHGSDLCHDSELKHAMANCFEALMGAIFLDGGIDITNRVFSDAMFGADFDLYDTWVDLPQHPLQTQEPEGDRHWIAKFPVLQKLTKFEEMTGIEFTHIRLLSRAFTDRSIGFNNLTLGSNQRMEFLGDTVLQLITSDFLYKHFPDHHEGHLSLLRSSLVNNRTQSVVCDDLGMTKFAVYANPKAEIKVKDKADLLEAFLGALYVDKDLEWCTVFAHVCFFPRLQQFILNQDWNDPKSKLQQCCLTLRTMDGGEPDIPVYKVIECKGPTNTRVYTVAVYFRGERLAKDYGHSIQQAEMNAAKIALEKCEHLFPHLNYQKRIMERSFKRQGVGDLIRDNWYQETLKKRAELGMDVVKKEEVDGLKNTEMDKSSTIEDPTNLISTSVCSSTVAGTVKEAASTVPVESIPYPVPSINTIRRDNKDAVRKEIQEIEDQLARRKKKQNKEGDIEDGECIDSEEDFEKSGSGTNVENVADKKKEENRKRWGKDKPSGAEPSKSTTPHKSPSVDKSRDKSRQPSSSGRESSGSRVSSRSGHGRSTDRTPSRSGSGRESSRESGYGPRDSHRSEPGRGRNLRGPPPLHGGHGREYPSHGSRGAPWQHKRDINGRDDRGRRGGTQPFYPEDRGSLRSGNYLEGRGPSMESRGGGRSSVSMGGRPLGGHSGRHSGSLKRKSSGSPTDVGRPQAGSERLTERPGEAGSRPLGPPGNIGRPLRGQSGRHSDSIRSGVRSSGSPNDVGRSRTADERLLGPPGEFGRPQGPPVNMGRPLGPPSDIGRPPEPIGDIGKPPGPIGDIGRPPGSSNDIGRPPEPSGDIGRPPESTNDIGRPTGPTGDIGRPTGPPSDVGKPVVVPGISGRPLGGGGRPLGPPPNDMGRPPGNNGRLATNPGGAGRTQSGPPGTGARHTWHPGRSGRPSVSQGQGQGGGGRPSGSGPYKRSYDDRQYRY